MQACFPFAAGLLLVLAAGCVVVDASRDGEPKAETDAARSSLLRTDLEFAKLSVARGAAEAFATYFAEDGTFLPMNAHPIFGREAIRAYLENGPSDATLTWKPLKAEVARSGELGYTFGTYEMKRPDADGQTKVSYGKYVTIWRKQADGSWKVVLDAGNPSPPPDRVTR